MRIIKLSKSHKNDLATLAMLMHGESGYSCLTYSPEKTAQYITNVLVSADYCCFGAVNSEDKLVGMFCGYLSSYPFSHDLIACDFILYVLPEYRGSSAGIRLINAYEYWARKCGAKIINIGTTTEIRSDAVCSLFEKLNYRKTGSTYRKEV